MATRVKHQESNTSTDSAQHLENQEYPPSYESVVYGNVCGSPCNSNEGLINLSEQQSTSSFDPDISTTDWTTQLIPNGSRSDHFHKAIKNGEKLTNVRYSNISGGESVQIELRTDTTECATSDGALLDSETDLLKRPASYLCFSFAVCLFCNPCFGFAAIICACRFNLKY